MVDRCRRNHRLTPDNVRFRERSAAGGGTRTERRCLACEAETQKRKRGYRIANGTDPGIIAQQLKEFRELQGTQATVAMKAGVNAWTLQHRELNLRRNLRIVQLYAESIGVEMTFTARAVDNRVDQRVGSRKKATTTEGTP